MYLHHHGIFCWSNYFLGVRPHLISVVTATFLLTLYPPIYEMMAPCVLSPVTISMYKIFSHLSFSLHLCWTWPHLCWTGPHPHLQQINPKQRSIFTKYLGSSVEKVENWWVDRNIENNADLTHTSNITSIILQWAESQFFFCKVN